MHYFDHSILYCNVQYYVIMSGRVDNGFTIGTKVVDCVDTHLTECFPSLATLTE
jgi:hypothetical protein